MAKEAVQSRYHADPLVNPCNSPQGKPNITIQHYTVNPQQLQFSIFFADPPLLILTQNLFLITRSNELGLRLVGNRAKGGKNAPFSIFL